ncbi:hypothetical protein Ahy_B09g095902 [Arachis hypogaea]|uniref:Uncharacterized protein n=1 Tax=Arachis hypogaea TaxID=3818 RepID=A0A444XGV8_ARAHY|nr:hypothetical protein Ahy_B09g095870 [Arachis hypogaea]RYQ89014.1 hypothetical protein Ahy_B09g095880 [Arachis hypogaea]RYQ89056.1 hypothetical protein Ahy_B09g095902 [Arachis hypogaea]
MLLCKVFKVLPTFTLAKIQELKNLEEEAKRNQSLKSLLLSPSGDFVISYYGNKLFLNSRARWLRFISHRVHMKDALTLLSVWWSFMTS